MAAIVAAPSSASVGSSSEHHEDAMSVDQYREAIIIRLEKAQARRELEPEVVFDRIAAAHRAATYADLSALIADMPPLVSKPAGVTSEMTPTLTRTETSFSSQEAVAVPMEACGAPMAQAQACNSDETPTATAVPLHAEPESRCRKMESDTSVTLIGSFNRSGNFTVPRRMYFATLLGGSKLDFSKARFQPGITKLTLNTAIGSANVIVPHGINVVVKGFHLIGSTSLPNAKDGGDDGRNPGCALLEILQISLIGGVKVTRV